MKRSLLAIVASATLATSAVAAESVEVLHWWTSGGEAAALGVLKKDLEGQGVTWNDMPVAGGGGEAAMTALRARVTSGNPPSAVQALGFAIKASASKACSRLSLARSKVISETCGSL